MSRFSVFGHQHRQIADEDYRRDCVPAILRLRPPLGDCRVIRRDRAVHDGAFHIVHGEVLLDGELITTTRVYRLMPQSI